MKKLYIIPKTELFGLDVDVTILEGSNGDEIYSRQRGGYEYEYQNSSSRNNNKPRGERWGSLW